MNKNIVLVGFMGTGKSEVGTLLAEKLNKKFVDTDKIIEQREKDRIVRIFQVKGEEYFRKVEEEVIEEVSKYENCVIATGGGALIRE
ncbi:MAG: shikimate kinase, partial [Candidatus Omnitrophica bacterium]|nr:shikimate kinase [Candidatus Omnitrophota bacterium]